MFGKDDAKGAGSAGTKRIAVFGGSFNPPHLGHVKICEYLLDTVGADEVWVIPCFIHPFGKVLASFEDRLAMCRFTFQDFRDRVRILPLEKELGGVSYTVRTLKNLLERYQSNQFMLVVGGDITSELSEWDSLDEIREMAKIVRVPRGANSFVPNISSTEIRDNIRNGRPFADLVTREVAVYIITHGLYQD